MQSDSFYLRRLSRALDISSSISKAPARAVRHDGALPSYVRIHNRDDVGNGRAIDVIATGCAASFHERKNGIAVSLIAAAEFLGLALQKSDEGLIHFDRLPFAA